jgi:peptide/nickel transport system substrate-binding protein
MTFRSATAVIGAAAVLAVGSAGTWAAAPVAASAAGGVIPLLTIGDTGAGSSLDVSKFAEAGNVPGALEGLLTYGPNGQPEPQLAQSVSTPNRTTYVFHLRHGVTFWDGDAMTSADVVNTLDYYRRPASVLAPAYVAVKSVQAAGPYTVVVALSQPDAAFESWLAEESLIFEKKFQEEHPTTMGDPSVGIMGTGAFEVDSWDPTTGIQLSANPHWWGGPVRVEHVSVKFFANETSEALAFRAGEVNVAFPAGSSFGSTAGVKVEWAPSDYEGMFSMNVHVAPWDNIYVRRAVAYALNRTDLVKALGIPGQAVTTLIPPDQLGLLGSRAQVSALINSLPSYPYNLATAKAELAMSPYPHGFTAPTNTLECGTYTPETEVIAAELAKIGINLNIREQSFTQWIATAVGQKTYGNLYTSWDSGISDPSSIPALILGRKNVAQGEGNSSDYDPPEVDTLMTEGLSTLDATERLAIYGKMLRIINTDLPYVPLFVQDSGLALSSNYSWPGFTQWSAWGPWELDLRQR